MSAKGKSGVSWFRVCRCCRAVFAGDRPDPFCDAQCTLDWARMALQSRPALRGVFLCAEPPPVQRHGRWIAPMGWQEAERAALEMERIDG